MPRIDVQNPPATAPTGGRELLQRLTVRPVVVTPALREPVSGSPWEYHGGSIRTPRLEIRPLNEADRPAGSAVFAAAAAAVAPHFPLIEPGETPDAAFDRHLAQSRDGDLRGNAWRRVITLRGGADAGAIVGGVNLNAIRRGMTFEADMTWWLCPGAVGRGLALEAVRAALGFASADMPAGLGLHRIHAGITPVNVRSVALALRAGFIRDGERSSFLKIAGRWERHDFYIFDAPTP